MKTFSHWNRVAHVGSFVVGYAWGGFAVLSGKVANMSGLAIAVGLVTVVALLTYAISPCYRQAPDAESKPSES